jgi:hypothetical protein
VTANPKRLEAERYKWAFKFVDLGIFIAIGTAVQVNVFAVNNGLMDDKWHYGMLSVGNQTEQLRQRGGSSALLNEVYEISKFQNPTIITKPKDFDILAV